MSDFKSMKTKALHALCDEYGIENHEDLSKSDLIEIGRASCRERV